MIFRHAPNAKDSRTIVTNRIGSNAKSINMRSMHIIIDHSSNETDVAITNPTHKQKSQQPDPIINLCKYYSTHQNVLFSWKRPNTWYNWETQCIMLISGKNACTKINTPFSQAEKHASIILKYCIPHTEIFSIVFECTIKNYYSAKQLIQNISSTTRRPTR